MIALIFAVMLVLKLSGLTDPSWWAVFAPAIGWLMFALGLFLLELVKEMRR